MNSSLGNFIEIESLGLTYSSRRRVTNALDGISFSICQGERVAITGESGSGKSSLLSLIGGFRKPTAGTCRVGGQLIEKLDPTGVCKYRSETIGFVFQHYCLLPHLTLLENIMLGVDHDTKNREAWTQRALELLGLVGLHEMRSSFPSDVSGGQAQRVGIARAMLRDPKLLLADEPTGSLDPQTASEILDLLERMCDRGCTLLIVTHDEAVASRMSRRIRLNLGKIESDAAQLPVVI